MLTCRGAGDCLQESDAVRAQLFQVGFLAAVGQQQDKDADGFVVTIVQADTDQMDAGAVHGQQHALQVGRLLEPQGRDHVLAVRQLPQPHRACVVLGILAPYVECRQVLDIAGDDQAVRLQAHAFVFPQVDQPGLGLADLHGFKQHPLQQRVEAGFRGKAGGDFKKLARVSFMRAIDTLNWSTSSTGERRVSG